MSMLCPAATCDDRGAALVQLNLAGISVIIGAG